MYTYGQQVISVNGLLGISEYSSPTRDVKLLKSNKLRDMINSTPNVEMVRGISAELMMGVVERLVPLQGSHCNAVLNIYAERAHF